MDCQRAVSSVSRDLAAAAGLALLFQNNRLSRRVCGRTNRADRRPPGCIPKEQPQFVWFLLACFVDFFLPRVGDGNRWIAQLLQFASTWTNLLSLWFGFSNGARFHSE